jgi:hypothetical protein
MEYALLFYVDHGKLGDPTGDALAVEMAAAMREVEAAGAFKGAHRLCLPETATTQCVRDGKVLTTDGPFSDTKECLAGLWVVECADLDEALAWAERVPLARYGSVEIRPTRPCPG